MENKPMQILFAAFEALPFFKSGGLGDVAGSLPGKISGAQYDIRVILPKLSQIPDKYTKKMKIIAEFEVPLAWRRQYCGLFELRYKGIMYYFVDNEYYFKRGQAYGEYDDGERIAFFSKAILESIQYIEEFEPDIIHCNDWHTALVPVFLREMYRGVDYLNKTKTVFTVHNLKFQGQFSDYVIGDILGLNGTPAENQLKIDKDSANYMMGALHYSDRITTVSPSYAEEVCTPYFGEGLDWLFRERKDILSGILNGIDNKQYDPATDKALYYPFAVDSLRNKGRNKLQLQAECGLAQDETKPLFILISRLTEQKGLDLMMYIMHQIMERECQLIVLGVGDRIYEDAFKWYAERYPEKMKAYITFDEEFSHKLYGCADALLMPSRFEPCGLSQMFAMRYGTLPVVRETGGLKDSVKPYNKYTGEGTGFSFANYNADEMLSCIDRALTLWYKKPAIWKKLQKNAMAADFSWRVSANKYRKLYRELLDS